MSAEIIYNTLTLIKQIKKNIKFIKEITMKKKLLSTIVISSVALTTSLSANASKYYKDDKSNLDAIGRVTDNLNNNETGSGHRQS